MTECSPEEGGDASTSEGDFWASLRNDGYAVVPLLDETEVVALSTALEAVSIPKHQAFVASHVHLDLSDRRLVNAAVNRVLDPHVSSLLPGWRIITSALIWKPPEIGARTEMHQDLTFTDERTHRSYVLWAPLVDTNEASGQLVVVPGSHAWTHAIRPGGLNHLPTGPHQDQLWKMSVALDVAAGSAVIWDSALVHGSTANRSAHARPAVASALIPKQVPITYFHRMPGGTVEGYRVDEQYFFTPKPFFERPEGFQTVQPWADHLRSEDLTPYLSELEL